MLLPSPTTRRLSVVTQASGAPTPLRAHKRGKISKSKQEAPYIPRGPIDALANQIPDPLMRAAVKEPVAFWGGIFAGVFRLSLDQDPLKTWVERTSSQAQAATGQTPQPDS